jgi:Cytochrome c biogenesis factor
MSSSRRKRSKPAESSKAAREPIPEPVSELTPRRVALFYAITLALPLLLLLAAEGILRVAWPGGRLPLFVASSAGPSYIVTNPRVAERWFASEQNPPTPIPEPFQRVKSARAFRVFTLGESTTAGFPYPHNGTFSRVLHDALQDVLPQDSVEVINLGIPATNSFALVDEVTEILGQHPDAIVIYVGHNEYYGALGVGSTERGIGSPALVRASLALQRHSRLALAIRDGIAAFRRMIHGGKSAAESPSFMETLARDQEIPIGGKLYKRGIDQLEQNLDIVLGRFAAAGVPVFIGSLASNLRDQAPFVAATNTRRGGADSVFGAARAALAGGDTARARDLFVRARDLDVVRFRAPTALNDVVRQAAKQSSATYVGIAEAFAAASPGGIPGSNLFLEHVHPNEAGTLLIARAFFEAMRDHPPAGHAFELSRLASWDDYARRMALTPFDERIALHSVRTVTSRWPFVPSAEQKNYRKTYHPTDLVDSLSFMVSAGGPWGPAKVRLAQDYQRRHVLDSAIAEYRGLARDVPYREEPWELLGDALLQAGHTADGEQMLNRAMRISPTSSAAYLLGMSALRQKKVSDAIPMLRLAVRLRPGNADALYQLSLASGLAQDLPSARSAAAALARFRPDYPGLAAWMHLLGMR